MTRKHLWLLSILLGVLSAPAFATDAGQPSVSNHETEVVATARYGSEVPVPEPDGDQRDENADRAASARYGGDVPPEDADRDQPAPDQDAQREAAPEQDEPEDAEPETEGPRGILDRRDVVAHYGHPMSTGMGILGEYSIEENARRLRELAQKYDELNGDRGVVPAFHIIYATATREADVSILDRGKLMEYIRFAEENDFVVILDHQIGDDDVVSSMRTMYEFLTYDSVHLAFDPEWSTDRPNEVIGSVTAEQVNAVQREMQEYMIENGIEGRKMLVVHQFNWRMIENREDVRADFERIDLVHNADGFGSPSDKRDSWQYNVSAKNIPLKGFKLFYPKEWRDGGYDDPLMSPEEVMSLNPQPVMIMYQ